MKVVKSLLAIVLALVLQTALASIGVQGGVAVDLVLVAVTYVGLTSGPVLGIIAGTIGGLAQDSLTSGIIGMGGLAKTIVGFLAGVIGTQFIVSQMLIRFLVFFVGSLLQSAVTVGLGMLLGVSPVAHPYMDAATQALGNALVGIALFQLIELLPGVVERRRTERGRIATRRLRE